MVEADIPDLSSLAIASGKNGQVGTSTATTSDSNVTVTDAHQVDTSLSSALSHLVHRLTHPLAPIVPHATLLELREALRDVLHAKFAPTWDESNPLHGSGYRSLICQRDSGLPVELREIAKRFSVKQELWVQALAMTRSVEGKDMIVRIEWEAWCDPGLVAWRYGPWEWEDVGFEPTRPIRDPVKTIWQALSSAQEQHQIEAAASFTPARPSHAIPIRAPAVFQIPPTPSQLNDSTPSLSLLPAASIDISGTPTANRPSAFSSPESEEETSGVTDPARYGGEPLPRLDFRRTRQDKHNRQRSGHAGSDSTSSVDSTLSDTNSGMSQLMTPDTRPPSADIFESIDEASAVMGMTKPRGRTPSPDTPHAIQRESNSTPATVTGATPAPASSTTPTITPYDGGNVTVLGGGVRLGGSSRPSSVMSANRTPIDRSRSPSISLASRALNNALGPNSTGGSRKARTRRRIMPTYLGSIHQPGVGGPINGAFSHFVGNQGGAGVQPGYNGQNPTSPIMWQTPPGLASTPHMPRPPQQAPRTVS